MRSGQIISALAVHSETWALESEVPEPIMPTLVPASMSVAASARSSCAIHRTQVTELIA